MEGLNRIIVKQGTKSKQCGNKRFVLSQEESFRPTGVTKIMDRWGRQTNAIGQWCYSLALKHHSELPVSRELMAKFEGYGLCGSWRVKAA